MENFENKSDWEKEEELRKLRAESILHETQHKRLIFGKNEDKQDDFDFSKISDKRFEEIINHYEEYKEYYKGKKEMPENQKVIQHITENLLQIEKNIESLRQKAQTLPRDEIYKIDEGIQRFIKVQKELLKILEEKKEKIEKFEQAEKPDQITTKIGKSKDSDAWKN